MIKTVFRTLCALFSLAILVGCGGAASSSGSGNVSQKAESSYCTTVYSGGATPLTITGQANYQYKATTAASGLAASFSSRGIPFSEIIVRNSAGTIVQCDETDGAGSFSFLLPKVADTYTVYVNSRADNSKIKLSVLKDVNSNEFYSTTVSFTVTAATASIPPLTTTALGSGTEAPGAAFHILYNIYQANEFIRNTVSSSFVADKVSVYWKAGFNPGTYVGTTSPLSFYIQGSRQLYILGGNNGNSTTVDFDHFDDSVILHEYGHFLEDVYSKSDSQGGSHNGNFIIDPRLAWSEGWANFFQGAVVRQQMGDTSRGRYYIDVTNGSSSMLRFDLGADGGSTSTDQVNFAGEGTFREISVSRTLWKTLVPSGAPANPAGANVSFAAFWTAFSDANFGIKNVLDSFRNIGLFNYYLDQQITANYPSSSSAWNSILSNERQNKTTADYANLLTLSATCAQYPKTLSPVVDSSFSGIPRSNQLLSNDFYKFNYTGGGGVITLTYAQGTSSTNGDPIDLDLYIYRQGYVYQEDYYESLGQSNGTVAAKSDRTNPAFETGSESINLSGLSAGTYLINVKAFTYGKISAQLSPGNATYNMTLGGQYLCPSY